MVMSNCCRLAIGWRNERRIDVALAGCAVLMVMERMMVMTGLQVVIDYARSGCASVAAAHDQLMMLHCLIVERVLLLLLEMMMVVTTLFSVQGRDCCRGGAR